MATVLRRIAGRIQIFNTYSRVLSGISSNPVVFSKQRQNHRNGQFNSQLLVLSAGFLAMASSIMDPPRRRKNLSAKEDQLFRAVNSNSIEEIKKLLSSGDLNPNCRHQLGWTPLCLAVVSGNDEAAKILLSCGADPNVGDMFTNIYDKAQDLQMPTVEVMFWRDSEFSERYRLNTNRTTFRGCTPLHYAVSVKNPVMVQLLLDSGADPTLENDMGYRPSDYATDDDLYNYLLECEKTFEKIKEDREAKERLRYPLERRLRENLVGQEAAIRTVASAIRRWQSGWADDEHPLVLMFLGSSGIGKTELAKQVAFHLSHSQKKNREVNQSKSKGFIRLDMSEYQERHSVARLIGSPPGYIGHEEGGQLTAKLSETPDSVVLFDEIEKAHPDVLTVLLQLFDEGRMTDGKGKTIECTKAIFIMTSNLASDEIATYSQRLRDENEGRQVVMEESVDPQPLWVSKKFKENVIRPILKSHFKRDEFLGRINDFVYFLPFSRRELMQLVGKELNIWAKRAENRHKITLIWDRSALDVLADGYNIHYGARSIKHEVERQVIDRLAVAHDMKLIDKDSVVRIVGDRKSNESLLVQDGTSASPSNQFERDIRLQIKRFTQSGDYFEEIDDKKLLEAIDHITGTSSAKRN